MELNGKGVLIAGARRVGAVLAQRLAREGMRVALTYRNSAHAMQELAAELAPVTGPVPVVQADLTQEASVCAMVSEAQAGLGNLFAVVNLASDYERTPLDSLDAAAFDRAMGAAKASYLMALHASRAMRTNPGPTRGHLIFFSDWASRDTPYRDYLPYLTAKAAIEFMTRGFASELASHGILVNAIAPGPTMRPPDITPESWQQDVLGHTPLGRESTPEDIAEMITGLLRTESVTGEVIRVDSGRHIAGTGWPN